MPQGKLNSFANAVSTRMSENELFVALKIEVDDLKARYRAGKVGDVPDRCTFVVHKSPISP